MARVAKTGKQKIVWNPGMSPASFGTNRTNIIKQTSRLEPRFSKIDKNEDLMSCYKEHLYHGAPWILLHDLSILMKYDHNINAEVPVVGDLPQLVKTRSQEVWAPKGLIVIFTGVIYIDELASGKTIRVLRPTFIVNNGRFVIRDLTYVKPAESKNET